MIVFSLFVDAFLDVHYATARTTFECLTIEFS